MHQNRRGFLAALGGSGLFLAGCSESAGPLSNPGDSGTDSQGAPGCEPAGVESRIRITPRGVTAVFPETIDRRSVLDQLEADDDHVQIYERESGSGTSTYVVFTWMDTSPQQVRESFQQTGYNPEAIRTGVGPVRVEEIRTAIEDLAAESAEFEESELSFEEAVDGETQHLFFSAPGDLLPLVPVVHLIGVNWATEFSGGEIVEARPLIESTHFDLRDGFDFRTVGGHPGFVFHLNEVGIDRLVDAIENTGVVAVRERAHLQLVLEGRQLSTARFSPGLVEAILDGSWEGRLVFPVGTDDQRAILDAAHLPTVPMQVIVTDC